MEGKILVVEDDSAIASMVELVLRTNGFETMLCARGDTAVATMKEYNPDLILLDIMLPGKDGFSVASEIRTFSKVPIVMLTAKTDTEDIVRGLEASGADDYITKPCPPRVLLARIRSRLRVHDAQPLHIVDLVLDVKGHKVTRNGNEIKNASHASRFEFKKPLKLFCKLCMTPDTIFHASFKLDLCHRFLQNLYPRRYHQMH